MTDVLIDFVKTNLGPFLFIAVASLLCYMLPQDKAVEAIYLVIGAALTRIKRTDYTEKPPANGG